MSEVADATISGLSQQEAETRLKTYGPNVVVGGKKDPDFRCSCLTSRAP